MQEATPVSSKDESVSLPKVTDDDVSRETTDSPHSVDNGGASEHNDRDLAKPLTKAEEKRLFKIKTKVDGIETESEYDEDQARILIQKGLAADKRFQESAMARKQAEEAILKLRDKASLIDILKQLGHDPRALAEEFLANELEYQLMTPEKKKIFELERERFEYQQREKQREAADKESKEKEARDRITTQLQGEVIEALKGSSLPQTSEMVSRMAYQMKIHLQKGIDITAKEAAKLVEDQLVLENQAIFKKMDLQKAKKVLGQDFVNQLLKDSLSQVKDPVKREPRQPGEQPVLRANREKKHFNTPESFEKHMQAIRGKR